MGAKQIVPITADRKHVVKRYKTCLTYDDGQALYFRQELTDEMFKDAVKWISQIVMNSYNEGVDDIRRDIRGALGL